MLLIQLNGNLKLIYHENYLNELKQACQRGEEFAPLVKLQKAISEAKQSLERSTPLQHVVEYFFLPL